MNNELLEQIKTNVPLVYEAGKDKGIKEMEPQLEEKYEEGKAIGISEGTSQGYTIGFEDGKMAERSNFWEVFQKGGTTKVVYNNAFSYGKFNDENYNPKYDILVSPGSTTADQMFYNSGLTSTKKPIYNECSRLQNTFAGCTQMVEIPYLHLLETTTFTNPFKGCTELVTLIIGGTIGKNGFDVSDSTKLNKASIESIINALSSTTSGLTVTLSKTAVNNAFGINVGDASTYPEGSEYYELRQSKSNWTISYA